MEPWHLLWLILPICGGVKANCDYTVSKAHSVKNDECHSLCQGGDQAAFDASCQYEPYQIFAGYALPSGTCFEQWAPGYSDEGFLGGPQGANIGAYSVAPSAEDCQLQCQNDPTCAYFVWRAVTVPGGNEYQRRNGCLLKTPEMMEHAINIIMKTEEWPVEAVDPRWPWCNMNLAALCGSTYTCQRCDGEDRCIYHGVNFISGPKNCADPPLSCGVVATTTLSPTTPLPTTTQPALPTTQPALPTTSTPPTSLLPTTKPTTTTKPILPLPTTTTTTTTTTTNTAVPAPSEEKGVTGVVLASATVGVVGVGAAAAAVYYFTAPSVDVDAFDAAFEPEFGDIAETEAEAQVTVVPEMFT